MTRAMIITVCALTLCACNGDDDDDVVDAAPIDIDAPASDGCRQTTECPPNEGCVGPNDVACGIPPQESCQNDADCGPDLVCHAISDSCSQDGIGSQCATPCNAGDACGDNLVCNAAGACRPLPCDDPAVDCRASEVCDPASVDPAGPVHAITHGCTIIACADDGPCPGDTVCVNNYCQDGAGVCSPPVP